MTEREVYQGPTQRQLEVIYREPEARDVFYELSAPVQQYLHMNWLSSNPLLSREERKELRSQLQTMALDLFGQENKDKGYNKEMQRWSNVIWMEIWEEEESG